MKNIDTKISILNNTNRIVSSSNTDWEGLRQNSNILIGNDKGFYTIVESKRFFYVKSFKRVDDQRIKIDDSVKLNLLVGDKIDLSYKEFYAIEGELDVESTSNDERMFSDNSTIDPIKVRKVKGSKQVEVVGSGRLLSRPKKIDGCSFSYNEFSDRKMVEYEIISIDVASSTLLLNKRLPEKVSEGKISTRKWEAFLNVDYVGHDRINVSCHITRDFTPNLGLPIVPNFGPAQASVLNEIFKKLDAEIQAIKDKVGL